MDNNAMLKAIGVGVGVFILMMLIFWGIAKFSGMPILPIPQRTVAPVVSVAPTVPAFLK